VATLHSPDSGVFATPIAARDPKSVLSSRTRAALWLTLAFWGSNYVLLTLGTALSGNEYILKIAVVRIFTSALGLGFCYLIHLLLTHPRLSTNKRRLIALALVSPIAAETFAWAVFFAEAAVDPSINISKFTWAGAVRTISFWTWFFVAWAGLYMALMYSFDVRDEQRRAAELKEQAHVARLRALHSQINPHFLFNSLNSVSALILDKDTEAAEAMVTKLARFLRLGLAVDPTQRIALSLEVELQRSYLEIEQLRFPDLVIDISVPDELEDTLVPALILQPLVENAVKYGVAGADPPATVSIEASADDSTLMLQVRDSGMGKSQPKSSGIGLSNIRQRLQLLYGEGRAALAANKQADGRYLARITIPREQQ
jgi:two-component system LytT family sensor kinase